MKAAAKSARDIAACKLDKFLRDRGASTLVHGDDLVDIVLDVLREPDKVMIDAGRAEIVNALPASATSAYQRDLAAAIWRSMMHRVSR